MNILVCLKQTFDTEERIEVKENKVNDDSAEFVINPYDEYGVEEGIRLKEAHPDSKVTIVTVGPTRAETSIRKALAMGADDAIIINTDSYSEPLDEFAISNILAETIKQEAPDFDIILCGYMAVDDGSAQVGPRLAELLNIPHISTIVKLEVEGKSVKAEKDVEGDVEFLESSLPILVTAQQGLNEPRYTALQGIMKAKKKPLKRLEISDLNLQPALVASRIKTHEVFTPPKKEMGKILTGEVSEQVNSLISLLRTEAKVI